MATFRKTTKKPSNTKVSKGVSGSLAAKGSAKGTSTTKKKLNFNIIKTKK